MLYCKTETLVVKLQWNSSQCHSPPSDFFGTAFHLPAEMLPLSITCFTNCHTNTFGNTTATCRVMAFAPWRVYSTPHPLARSERGGEKEEIAGKECTTFPLYFHYKVVTLRSSQIWRSCKDSTAFLCDQFMPKMSSLLTSDVSVLGRVSVSYN